MGKGEGDIASVLTVLGSRRDDLAIAQELIEVLPIPVFFKARDGRYLGVNRAWEEFFGISRGDIIGGSGKDLYPASPAGAERHAAMDDQLWHSPGKQSLRVQLALRDGRARHTTYYKATFARPASEGAGLIGTIADI